MFFEEEGRGGDCIYRGNAGPGAPLRVAKPKEDGDVFELEDVIEKPAVDEAPSNLVIAARYIFAPSIFEALEQIQPGAGGEYQLTDARAGLLGNPSDGYNGKTIAISVRNFRAEVVLYEWDSVDIVQSRDDRARFRSIHDLAQDVRLHGYYGGIRLIKATIKRFADYCSEHNLMLHNRNFSVRYETNIPRQVGLAGFSSSIIVATLRCLMEFYEIEIPLELQPSFVLSIETEELGISAGLQDRVIQCYEGVVYMNFDKLAERKLRNNLLRLRKTRPCPAAAPLYCLSQRAQRTHRNLSQ